VHVLSDQVASREDLGETRLDEAEFETENSSLVELFLGLVKERHRHPRDDVITLIMDTPVVDDDGHEHVPDDVEIAVRFQELAFAGHETVAKVIPNGVIALAWYPDQRRELAHDPALLRNAVEEVLRWDPPSHLQGRTTTRDVELHGVTIPAGSRTMLITASANHDERAYDEPELFDLHRDIQHPVSFGFGLHVCLGAHLARLEMRIAFEELLARYPDFHVDGSRAVRHVVTNVRGLSNLPLVIDSVAEHA
jgi:cytochrome P450